MDLVRIRTFSIVAFILSLHLSACGVAALQGQLMRTNDTGDLALLAQSRLSGEVTLSLVLEDEPTALRAEFMLNGIEPDAPPWQRVGDMSIVLDTALLFDGRHELMAVAVDSSGSRLPGSVSATFDVSNRGTGQADRMPRSQGLTLRGDSTFAPERLSQGMRLWYDRLWAGIEARTDEAAESGDMRQYGYMFQEHMAFLFTALRATGDLRFADEIARLADIMANTLTTRWVEQDGGASYAPDDGTDGLRRFLYLSEGDWYGKDTQVLVSVLTHGMVANMAYVFEANRGLPSPASVDYGSKADFWTDYLRNDFEEIWRIRENAAWPEFPLWDHQVAHAFKSQMRWAYYMYALTGDEPYFESARQYAAAVREHMFRTETSLGPAVVWSHRLLEPGYGLQPIAYSRYEHAMEADLAFEGGLDGIDADYMAMQARTVASFVLDNGTEDISFDVGGMQARRGESLAGGEQVTIPSRKPWDGSGLEYGRELIERYMDSYFAPLAAFAATEEIVELSLATYRKVEDDIDVPDRLAIPTGMLLVESLGR